jgi:cytochrome c2
MSGAAKAETPGASQGAALWQKFACANCHRLGGAGETVGPELDQVTLRRSRDRIFRWLGDPTTASSCR